mmetsp:Transcript_30496/g.94449  ORF Transcript_30496/g.94449 Transcript_30496/m.94449 type:complete len:174 (-) Transcript_30496:340-861(-)
MVDTNHLVEKTSLHQNNLQLERISSRNASLERSLDGLSKQLAKECLGNSRYKVKLNAYRSLDNHIAKQLAVTNKSSSFGRALAAEATIKSLKETNSLLRSEVARMANLENDFSKIQDALHMVNSNMNPVDDLNMFKHTNKKPTGPWQRNSEWVKTTGDFDALQDKVTCSEHLN